MITFPKQYKKFYNAYNKKLLAQHKANFSVLNNNMDYFITYLKMLRDYYLLTEQTPADEENISLKTASLVAAVSEYEKYITCITNYYKLNGNMVEKVSEESDEEVSKKYNIEKKFH